MFKSLFEVYEYHFKEKYSDEISIKLDALIWETVFLRRIDRFDPRIDLICDFFMNIWKQLGQMEVEDVLKGNVPFNVFGTSFDVSDTNFDKELSREQKREAERTIMIEGSEFTYQIGEDKKIQEILDFKVFRMLNWRFIVLISFWIYQEMRIIYLLK